MKRKKNKIKNKKMGSKGMETRVLWLAVEIIILIVATLALLKVINAVFNPDKQITYANTQKLVAAMNEACISGKSTTMYGFQMPQPSPSRMWGVSDILPRLAISVGGDPHYVLYYEAFPPGEAIGWEVYQSLSYRVIAPLPDPEKFYAYIGKDIRSNEVPKNDNKKPIITAGFVYLFIDKVKSDAVQKVKEIEDSLPENERTGVVKPEVIIPNIILDDQKKSGKVIETVENFPGTIGQWQDKAAEGPNYYTFNAYITQPSLEKSAVKYRACGENSLCLKTREGMYTLPLDYCKGKVDYAELYYNSRDLDFGDIAGPAAGTATAKIGPAVGGLISKIPGMLSKVLGGALRIPYLGWVITAITSWKAMVTMVARYKVSDFYMASPCDLSSIGDITVVYLDGKTEVEVGPNDDKQTMKGCSCQSFLEYDLYKYNPTSGVLEKAGMHGTCLDANGGFDAIVGNVQPRINDIPCIKVYMNHDGRKKDFCWTSSPTTRTYHFSELQIADHLTEAVNGMFGNPVPASTDFMTDVNGVVLRPTGSGSYMANYADSWTNNILKGWSWKWPSALE